MNAAARLVLSILGALAGLSTVTLCALAVLTREGKDVKDIALLCIGAVAGVLAKVGYDAARDSSSLPLTTDAKGEPAVNTVESS